MQMSVANQMKIGDRITKRFWTECFAEIDDIGTIYIIVSIRDKKTLKTRACSIFRKDDDEFIRYRKDGKRGK